MSSYDIYIRIWKTYLGFPGNLNFRFSGYSIEEIKNLVLIKMVKEYNIPLKKAKVFLEFCIHEQSFIYKGYEWSFTPNYVRPPFLPNKIILTGVWTNEYNQIGVTERGIYCEVNIEKKNNHCNGISLFIDDPLNFDACKRNVLALIERNNYNRFVLLTRKDTQDAEIKVYTKDKKEIL